MNLKFLYFIFVVATTQAGVLLGEKDAPRKVGKTLGTDNLISVEADAQAKIFDNEISVDGAIGIGNHGIGAHASAGGDVLGHKADIQGDFGQKIDQHNHEVFKDSFNRQYVLEKEYIGSKSVLVRKYLDNVKINVAEKDNDNLMQHIQNNGIEKDWQSQSNQQLEPLQPLQPLSPLQPLQPSPQFYRHQWIKQINEDPNIWNQQEKNQWNVLHQQENKWNNQRKQLQQLEKQYWNQQRQQQLNQQWQHQLEQQGQQQWKQQQPWKQELQRQWVYQQNTGNHPQVQWQQLERQEQWKQQHNRPWTQQQQVFESQDSTSLHGSNVVTKHRTIMINGKPVGEVVITETHSSSGQTPHHLEEVLKPQWQYLDQQQQEQEEMHLGKIDEHKHLEQHKQIEHQNQPKLEVENIKLDQIKNQMEQQKQEQKQEKWEYPEHLEQQEQQDQLGHQKIQNLLKPQMDQENHLQQNQLKEKLKQEQHKVQMQQLEQKQEWGQSEQKKEKLEQQESKLHSDLDHQIKQVEQQKKLEQQEQWDQQKQEKLEKQKPIIDMDHQKQEQWDNIPKKN